MAHEVAHIAQMGRVGRKVIFDRLVVAYVDENVGKHTYVAVFVERRKHSALGHVLDYAYRFKRHRFTTCIRTGYDQQAALGGEGYVERYYLLALTPERSEQHWMARIVPLKLRPGGEVGKASAYFAGI